MLFDVQHLQIITILVGIGSRGEAIPPPPQYFANEKKISLKITTYKSAYSNKA